MRNRIIAALLASLFAAPAFAQENNGLTSGPGQSPLHFERQWREHTLFTKRTCVSMGADEQLMDVIGRMYGLLSPVTSATAGAVTAEITMAKYTFNQFANGKGTGLHVRIYGRAAANANTKQVQFVFGSTTVTLLNAASNAKDVYADIHVYNTGVNTQQICVAGYANGSLLDNLSVTSAQDVTAPIVVGVNLPTATANSDITLNEVDIEGEASP